VNSVQANKVASFIISNMSTSLIVASLSRKIQNKRNQKVLTTTRSQKLKTKLSKSIEFNLGFSLQQSSSKTNVQLSFNTGGPKLVGLSNQ
jgi:hypothetical protein